MIPIDGHDLDGRLKLPSNFGMIWVVSHGIPWSCILGNLLFTQTKSFNFGRVYPWQPATTLTTLDGYLNPFALNETICEAFFCRSLPNWPRIPRLFLQVRVRIPERPPTRSTNSFYLEMGFDPGIWNLDRMQAMESKGWGWS